MQYIDMHCDTLEEALAQHKDTVMRLDGTMVDAMRLKEGGAMAQFFAMFLPQRNEPSWFGLDKMPDLEELLRMLYGIYQNTMEAAGDFMASRALGRGTAGKPGCRENLSIFDN